MRVVASAPPRLAYYCASEQLVSGSGPAAGDLGLRSPSCGPPTLTRVSQDSHRAESIHPVHPSSLQKTKGNDKMFTIIYR